MNRADPLVWNSPRGPVVRARAVRGRSPIEVVIVSLALAGELIGALTDPLAGALVAIAIAAVVTLRYMRAEVEALQAWEASLR